MAAPNKPLPPASRWPFILALGLLLAGCAIVVVFPAAWKGPVLVQIDTTHALRLLDAIGLAIGTLAYLWLNAVESRRRAARRQAAQQRQSGRR
jgi:hypothetical protein